MKVIQKKITEGYTLIKRRFVVISMPEWCWCSLGVTKSYDKAMAIIHRFIGSTIDPDDKMIISPVEYDPANDNWERLTVTIPETDNHAQLEYPFMIFYEDKAIKELTEEEAEEFKRKHYMMS